jgi:hypothetical protein
VKALTGWTAVRFAGAYSTWPTSNPPQMESALGRRSKTAAFLRC